jgi:hypothetical protein
MEETKGRLNKQYGELLQLMQSMDKKLDIHIALNDIRKITLDEHERILKGSNGSPSLVEQVRQNTYVRTKLEKILEAVTLNTDRRLFMERVVWMFMTPLMLAMGSGIIYLIVQGAAGK